MKKAYIVKDFNASWGVQNRVEALSDWAANGDTPYEIDITGNTALIILNDNKKTAYESEYKWDRDVATLEGLIKDIKDPIFAEDGQTFEEIDMEATNPNAVKHFENLALENCGQFGFDLLRPLGFENLPEGDKSDEVPLTEDVGARNVAELEEMAKNIDLTAGLEGLTPDTPIEEYSRENDPLLEQAETAPIETPVEVTPEHTAETQPVEEPAVEPEETAIAVAEASNKGISPSVGKIVDPKEVFVKELMQACDEYEVTPKGLVAIIMSIKALANKTAEADMISTESISADEYKSLRTSQYPKSFMKRKVTTTKQAKKFYKELDKLGVKNVIDLGDENAKFVESKRAIYIGDMYGSSAFLLPDGTIGFIDNEEDQGKFYKTSTVEKDIEHINTTPEDVTAKEDYSYQNAVPYVQDPHGVKDEDMEIPRQGMNVSGSMNNVEFAEVQNMINGNESITPNTNTEQPVPMAAEDVYSSLVNDGPVEFGELETPEEYVETSMEALFSKKKNKSDNEVLKDINKVLNDIKDIAKKAWNELQERNKELIAKYGAFIKLILDIKDIVFMDNRSISLQIASFNTKKANNEIVPDNTEEALLKQVSKGAVGAIFGPFANMAKGEDKPGQLMIAVANELRNAIIKQTKSFDVKPAINLVEDELSGVFTLVAEFKGVPQTANESIEETAVDERPLIERLAMESTTDDEFFSKVLEHKNDIEYAIAMDCVNNNMWAYFKTGEKLLNDRAVSSKRILQYIKK